VALQRVVVATIMQRKYDLAGVQQVRLYNEGIALLVEKTATMLTRHVDVHLASVLFSSLILTPLIFYALLCAVSLRPSV